MSKGILRAAMPHWNFLDKNTLTKAPTTHYICTSITNKVRGGGMKDIAVSFRGNIITTNSRDDQARVRPTNDGKKKIVYLGSDRRFDCEDYLDCLLLAAMANAGELPCKGCSKYVSTILPE